MGASMGFFRMQDCRLALSIEEGGDEAAEAFPAPLLRGRRLRGCSPGLPYTIGHAGWGGGRERSGGRLNHSVGFGLVRRCIFYLIFNAC